MNCFSEKQTIIHISVLRASVAQMFSLDSLGKSIGCR